MNAPSPLPSSAPDPRLLALAADRERFLGFVRRRLRTEADADDLLQQALLRAAERIGSLRQGERLDAWFFRILRNALVDHHAQRASQASRLTLLPEDVADASPREVAGCACALGMVEGLSPEQAEMIRRVDLGEESIEEAAAHQEISSNLARVRLHRGRKALREGLRRCCGAGSLRACMACSCERS